MEDPFRNLRFIYFEDDDTNFFPRTESEEIRKVVDRYIKKTEPKFYIVSTDDKYKKSD